MGLGFQQIVQVFILLVLGACIGEVDGPVARDI
jgi:hypothetical protein